MTNVFFAIIDKTSLAGSVSKSNLKLQFAELFFMRSNKQMPTKKIKTLRSLKNNLKKILPQKISEVIKSYENFAEHPAPDDAKGFSAHHTACKSAVVHAETLLKLARWTEDDMVSTTETDNTDIAELLAEAKEEEEDDDES